MQEKMKQEAASYLVRKHRRKAWKRIVGALACVVVFCTTYALILPAITMEKTPQCGKNEHTHSAACYAQTAAGSKSVPVCTLESLNLHEHTDACLNENGEYCCGYSDFVVHKHNSSCYDANGNLWCPLPQIEAHTHDAGCYAVAESAESAHTHTDACYTVQRGELTCTIPEGEGAHTHAEDCYDENGQLVCQQEESTGHQHTDDCYVQNKVAICGFDAEQAPASETESAQQELICEKQEIVVHEHQPDCFDKNGKLICGKQQVLEHIHGDTCFRTENETGEKTLTCQLEEHTHTPACHVIGLIEALPTQQSVEQRMTAFEEAGDEEGSDAYLTELQTKVQEAYEAYNALSKEEQAKVTNRNRLTELAWLLDVSAQADTAETATTTVTVTSDENTATVSQWTGDASEVQKRLQTALFAVDQGYTIQKVEYYQIQGLTGSQATVKYSDGNGLSPADEKSKVFVYDLGADGKATPKICTVDENPTKDGQLFTSFNFAIPEGSGDASHVYAFISAKPSTLPELGIYLGTEVDGTWVAYDGPDEVKATVKLPDNVTAPDGYRLFIRKINEGEGFYPQEDAVLAKAGTVVDGESKINDYQCYTIRWLKQETDGTLDMKPLNNGFTGDRAAEVKIEYLKDEAKLKGPAGGRKLLIYNSTKEGDLLDQVADTVENVTVGSGFYQTFTFQAKDAGPYVFVSKYLETGYIEQLAIASIADGSEPFDTDDNPGNDSSDSNKIVRSYDTIVYNLGANFRARQTAVTKESVEMYFEITLKKSATAARFNPSQMIWLGDNYSIEYLDENNNVIMIRASDGKYYEPQYNGDGTVVRDVNGFAQADKKKPVSLNAQLTGSRAGEDSYKVTSGGVATQRLVGCATVTANKGESILAGTQTFSAAVEVRNADDRETFTPSFKMWLEGNEDNYGPEDLSLDDSGTGTLKPATPVDKNELTANGGNAVTVSAGTNFNIQLKKNTDMSYKNWFDFKTGNVVAEPTRTRLVELAKLKNNHGKSNPADFVDEKGQALDAAKQAEYQNYRYGRITCYGITLQLYSNAEDKDRASKGMKGMSLPVGDITFDLNFYSEALSNSQSVEGADTEYTAILWDYNENVPAHSTINGKYVDPAYTGVDGTPYDARGNKQVSDGTGEGNGGRNLYWDGETRSSYAKGGAPSNYQAYHEGCYYGGDWALTDGSGAKVTNINTIANPTKVTGTGAGTTYHFSVSDYDFDFDNQHFPLQDAGNSGNVTGYDTYARGFSAGCVQVLSVFPMVQEVDEAEIYLNTTVSNLKLETRAGQELKAKDGDASKIEHEVNKADNTKRDQIVLYAPGNLTKGSSFNGRDKEGNAPESTTQGFLGTGYWTTSYDCNTFAGENIWLMSYGMMSAGSDYRMKSMNLLQLFDSRALSIRTDEEDCPTLIQNFDEKYDKPGTPTFLYAADPDYKDGYDTNKKGVLAYMNGVREEDLVYSENMPDDDGYITVNDEKMKCVGVLMELRGCDILGGKYQYMRIPVTVNGTDSDLVSKTVATVNTFRVWSENLVDKNGNPITWANGKWDDTNGKNELADYPTPTNGVVFPDGSTDGQYSGELANSQESSPPYYTKTEYKDNIQVTGTHAGGTLSGNSLLILGYKAHIGIDLDNKTGTRPGYNQGKGETVVDYRLNNIKTETSTGSTPSTNTQKTELTVKAVLDEENKTDRKDRISVAGGTFRIKGYKSKNATEEKEFHISEDHNHPTELWFKVKKTPETDEYDWYKIMVYAETSGPRTVSFVIQDAPVGVQLPDITFQANFSSDISQLRDNEAIVTNAYISGTSDHRAYNTTNGNTDNETVYIVIGSSTNLTKAVQERYIELNGTIKYDVTYTNSGTDTLETIYFYDLLPKQGDIRESNFEGDVVLRDFDVTSKGKEEQSPGGETPEGGTPAGQASDGGTMEGDPPEEDPSAAQSKPKAKVYYSTTEYRELYDTVKVFGGTADDNGSITGMNADAVENMLASGTNKKDEQLFMPLGEVDEKGEFQFDAVEFAGMTKDKITEIMSQVTGLYIKAENLQQGQTIDLSFTIETQGNKANDWYRNIANSWIAGSATLPLTSNRVETQTVSRNISGVVWYDRNLNGIRDDGEQLLKDVTATLLKKNTDTQKYEVCTNKVTGEPIGEVTGTDAEGKEIGSGTTTTNSDGAYSFDKLPAGEYIVAFSGEEALNPYNGATIYQKSKKNDSNTNDGKAMSDEIKSLIDSGIDTSKYQYYIHYSADSSAMQLHTIETMASAANLSSGVEAYEHQDLGLVTTDYELPMTGGAGTAPYTIGGLLTICVGGILFYHNRMRRRKDTPSS